MGRISGVGVLAAGALLLAGAGARAADRADIDRAIERGVSALKKRQGEYGTWSHTYKTGATALAGLTLLECDVPASDKAVQGAAAVVRPASIVPNARWINASVRVSIELVASSRIRMRGSASTARAKVRSCRWPWLSAPPPSPSCVS